MPPTGGITFPNRDHLREALGPLESRDSFSVQGRLACGYPEAGGP
jgi:hypothetical protein